MVLQIERLRKALKRVRERAREKLANGHPYVTVSLKRVKKDLEVRGRDGIDFFIRKLREEYRVGRDGTWLILEEKMEEE